MKFKECKSENQNTHNEKDIQIKDVNLGRKKSSTELNLNEFN